MSKNDSFYDLRGSCVHFSQSGENRGQAQRGVSELYIKSHTKQLCYSRTANVLVRGSTETRLP